MQPVTVMSIAGSDSGGGAGLQADLKTFAAFEVHGTTAVTAVTAQNTLGVQRISVVPVDVVRAQVESILDDFDVRAVKTGMLADADTIELVADLARAGRLPSLVVDPVIVSTTGHDLLEPGGVDAYRDLLLPHTLLVTPNLHEAAALAGVDSADVTSVEDLVDLAVAIVALGPAYALVKGGHLTRHDGHSTDVLVGPDGSTLFDAPRVDTINDHGTGCSLSAAIVAGLAQGRDVASAARDAKSFVLAGLQGAATWRLGAGRGPLDHLGWSL